MKNIQYFFATSRCKLDNVTVYLIYVVGLICVAFLYMSTANAFTYGDTVFCTPRLADLSKYPEGTKLKPNEISETQLDGLVMFKIQQDRGLAANNKNLFLTSFGIAGLKTGHADSVIDAAGEVQEIYGINSYQPSNNNEVGFMIKRNLNGTWNVSGVIDSQLSPLRPQAIAVNSIGIPCIKKSD